MNRFCKCFDKLFSHPNLKGGTPFLTLKEGRHVVKVCISSYETAPDGPAVIVAVELEFADRTTVRNGGKVGKENRSDIFSIPVGDHIVEAIVYSDWGTHGIQFVTKNGVSSSLYGVVGPQKSIFKAAAEGDELCGMSGRAGDCMNRVVFLFGNSNTVLRQYFQHPNGEGGTPFSTPKGGEHVVNVIVSSYETFPDGPAVIVAVELEFTDRTTVRHGGEARMANRSDIFSITVGDHIVEAIVYSDWGTHGIQFVTKNGVSSNLFGVVGPKKLIFKARAEGEELCGMKGRSGALMDKVVFFFGTPVHVKAVYCYLVPLISITGGVDFQKTEKIKSRLGMSANAEHSKDNLRDAVVKARQQITCSLQVAETNNQMVSVFDAALDNIHPEYELEQIFQINGVNGLYVYTPIVNIVMSDGVEFIVRGSSAAYKEPMDKLSYVVKR